MCVIIDTNVFASVFDRDSQDHEDFIPLLIWITRGKGFIVYGGSKYRNELLAARKYLKIITELSRSGKVKVIKKELVDKEEQRIYGLVDNPDFDDAHLIAIVSLSGCKIICSKDSRAYPFIKNRNLYPKGIRRPRIYRKYANKSLLVDQNVVRVSNIE